MKVYSINSTNFTAKKTQSTLSNTENPRQRFCNQIDKFLNNKCTKKEYIDSFTKEINAVIINRQKNDFTLPERKYINNLISVLDISEGIEKIPDNYLKTNMLKLLKSKM